jgi:hypothetical protein
MPRGHMLELLHMLNAQAYVNWRDVLERVDNNGPEVREFALQKAGEIDCIAWSNTASKHCFQCGSSRC